MSKYISIVILIILNLCFFGCASIPKNATPVSNFKVEKYLGTWYEIARIDFKQERNLNNTKAEYTLMDNGKIKVTNTGYHVIDKKWKTANGKAKFRGKEDVAGLKVSFFGPFYSGYNVIDIDEQYQYALIAGKNLDYLWILSRTKSIPDAIKKRFLDKATSVGYNTDRLLWVEHTE